MNKKRDRKSASPHSVAAIASFMVLVVGAGVGAYFVEFRGVGLQTMLAGAQAQELLMLFGGIAVCTLLTQFMVAGAARPAGAQDNVRDMMRTVLELDPNDPDAARKLESVPELHELAMMIAAEKNAKIETMQQLNAQRRDLAGLLQGMERSAVTGDPLREEQSTEISTQIACAWNTLVSNTAAKTRGPQGPPASHPPHMDGPGSPEPGMVTLNDAREAAAPAAADAVSERFERVEASVEALQRTVRELANAPATSMGIAETMPTSRTPLAPAPEVAPSKHESAALEIETTAAQAPDMSRSMALGAANESSMDDEPASSPSAYHEWNAAAQERARSSSPPVREAVEPLAGLEPSGFAGAADLPGMNDELPMADTTPEFHLSGSDALAMFDTESTTPDSGTPISPPLSESPDLQLASGASDTRSIVDDLGTSPLVPPAAPARSMNASDFELAEDVAPRPTPSFGSTPSDPALLPSSPTSDVSFGAGPQASAPVPQASKPDEAETKSIPALPEETDDQEFAQHFPHFVGQAVGPNEEQVEVTYAQDQEAAESLAPPPSSPVPQGEEPQANSPAPRPAPPTPESAAAGTAAPATPKNPRQFPESQVIDLRSLGAVEFED